ncbi:hypothetical protein OZN62_05300 [Aurantiacibacter sp. MUD11]|uniref:hypothetical protein n=1 Tax=Aurantiacibacter sp. MUD11 TaxID=3003265 RepID=UPI0022AA7310|nr:hypothetical protein [Aurantiacibacter sp. MUD11]WAT18985.1 hypothetical protein OZN62_05300 [Aurantiacibacter sp. MUD11]
MDPDLTLIFAFILTLLMIILPFAYLINKKVAEHEERKLELKARIEEAKAAQLRDNRQVDDLLEDRVRVLERIATDRSPALAAEIEDLRKEKVQ